MVPAFPWAQEQFLHCPTQQGPKLSEGSYQFFSPGHPFPNLSSLSLWAGYFFSFKASSGTCAVKRGQDQVCPQLPIREHTALSQSFLSAGFSLHSYASPLCEV